MARARTPRAAPTDRRKDELRRAAYQLFRERGYDDTTVDEICARNGVSKGAFYWHYESKHDVFLDILEAWTREVTDQMYARFLDAVRSPDYLAATTEALEREIRRGRVIVPLWLDFTMHARRDPVLREALARFYRRARMAVAEMIRPGLAGVLDEDGLQGVAGAIFGCFAGVLMQEMADPQGADARQAVQQLMVLLGKWLRDLPPNQPAPAN